MKVLFDTNIWIDIAVRPKTYPESAELLHALEKRAFVRCLPLCAYTTIYYLISKVSSPEAAHEFLSHIKNRSVHLLSFTQMEVVLAEKFTFSDFEDACIAATALNGACDVIATRNTRHFKNSPIPAVDPKALLKRL